MHALAALRQGFRPLALAGGVRALRWGRQAGRRTLFSQNTPTVEDPKWFIVKYPLRIRQFDGFSYRHTDFPRFSRGLFEFALTKFCEAEGVGLSVSRAIMKMFDQGQFATGFHRRQKLGAERLVYLGLYSQSEDHVRFYVEMRDKTDELLANAYVDLWIRHDDTSEVAKDVLARFVDRFRIFPEDMRATGRAKHNFTDLPTVVDRTGLPKASDGWQCYGYNANSTTLGYPHRFVAETGPAMALDQQEKALAAQGYTVPGLALRTLTVFPVVSQAGEIYCADRLTFGWPISMFQRRFLNDANEGTGKPPRVRSGRNDFIFYAPINPEDTSPSAQFKLLANLTSTHVAFGPQLWPPKLGGAKYMSPWLVNLLRDNTESSPQQTLWGRIRLALQHFSHT